MTLRATNTNRAWRIDPDWTVTPDPPDAPLAARAARVHAGAGDLALLVWERADPLRHGHRFRLEGASATVAAFAAAPVHPW